MTKTDANNMDNLDSLFAQTNAERVAILEKMAADYRAGGDLVSAQNCETKASYIKAAMDGKHLRSDI